MTFYYALRRLGAYSLDETVIFFIKNFGPFYNIFIKNSNKNSKGKLFRHRENLENGKRLHIFS